MCLGAALTTATAKAQVLSTDVNGDTQVGNTKSPVAYVYVACTPQNSKTNQIVAYTAAANGSLTSMPGSPFPENVYAMAVNGKYLMAASVAAQDINAYNIAPDGALTFAASTNYAQYNNPTNPCGSAGQIFFDHSGATLYAQEFDASDACTNTVYASFAVAKATGDLTYLGLANAGAFPCAYTAAYFIGNNVYAYSAATSGCMYCAYNVLQRSNSGLLSFFNSQFNLPTPPPGASSFLPDLVVADSTHHLAVIMQPANPPRCAPGPLQLASYTVDSNGNMNTNNTYKNMPASLIASPYDMKMAPSGKLLALAGQEGLQVFHFNGANPIKPYTGLLTSDPINQMFWDDKNHLYAISYNSAKLLVFINMFISK